MPTEEQKAENLLNLSLDATEAERERSPALRLGYDPEERTWELIVRYHGDLDAIEADIPGSVVYPLSAGYAIMRVPESQIESLTGFSQIEYIEKPKRLFFSVNKAKRESCITLVQQGNYNLTGRGVIVAVIDSGIDYYHSDFRDAQGNTRILELWDQQQNIVYTREQINEALQAGTREAAYRIVPSRDTSGHGTAVAGIAAGNGREQDGVYRGVAYESELLVVKLGVPMADSFPRTTELMRAIDYVINRAIELEMPVVINLSFGNTYGSHDGTSLIEVFINEMAGLGRTSIVIGTGNEGSAMGHTSGLLQMDQQTSVEMTVGEYELGFGVQLWKLYVDQFNIEIISPSGVTVGPISPQLGSQRIDFTRTTILLYYGKPSPYSQAQEIYFDFIPKVDYVDTGVWTFRLTPRSIVTGRYDFWLPSQSALNRSTHFLTPTPDTTLTIPSTAARAISVGAYDDAYQSYADFSGRGYTRLDNLVKPDLVAPGVNLVASRDGGGYEPVTGTSFATPIVSGSAALMMQWGIVDGNDPYLYGEKIKAYLKRGATPLPGESVYPNPRLGYGALCVSRSMP